MEKDKEFQNEFARWIAQNGFDSFYWCLNPDSGDTGGLLEKNWKTPVSRKLKILEIAHPAPSLIVYSE